jgi:hypothetical protein
MHAVAVGLNGVPERGQVKRTRGRSLLQRRPRVFDYPVRNAALSWRHLSRSQANSRIVSPPQVSSGTSRTARVVRSVATRTSR